MIDTLSNIFRELLSGFIQFIFGTVLGRLLIFTAIVALIFSSLIGSLTGKVHASEFYQCQDSAGAVEFRDRPCTEIEEQLDHQQDFRASSGGVRLNSNAAGTATFQISGWVSRRDVARTRIQANKARISRQHQHLSWR